MASNIKAVTMCQLCSKQMSGGKSRALQCLHSFCESCLERYVQNGQTIPSMNTNMLFHPMTKALHKKSPDGGVSSIGSGVRLYCPTCQEVTIIPVNGIQGLPYSFIHNHGEGMPSFYSRRDLCQACCENTGDARLATTFCRQCDRKMCEACHKTHSAIPVFQKHSIELYKPNHTGSLAKTCFRHGYPVELFCKTCRLAICTDCAMADCHKEHEHTICDLKEGSVYLAGEITALGDKISKEMKVLKSATEETRKSESDFDLISNQLRQHGDLLKNQISQQVDNLIAQLRRDRQDNLQNILQKYSPVCKQAEQVIALLSHSVTETTENRLIVSGAEYIVQGEGMLKELKKAKDSTHYREVQFLPNQKAHPVGTLKTETGVLGMSSQTGFGFGGMRIQRIDSDPDLSPAPFNILGGR